MSTLAGVRVRAFLPLLPLSLLRSNRTVLLRLLLAAIKIVAGKLLVYPNEFTLPLMPNFGLPPTPVGMLHVKVCVRASVRVHVHGAVGWRGSASHLRLSVRGWGRGP